VTARRIGEWEPAELGVHPAAGGAPDGSMPPYIRRPHDEKLRTVLDPAVADSRLVVVRGDAGAGTSRAAYEAVADRLPDWPLEYPPTPAALAAVFGLDELAVFTDPNPAYGGVVDVPARFTAEELAAAAGRGDPVLAAAAAAAGPDGRVAQYLAGGRELLDRYAGPGGDPGGQAIIAAAMDAARFGHAAPLPGGLLREAASGYLAGPGAPPNLDGEGLDGAGLEWAGAVVNGAAARAIESVPAGYLLAGYLEQHGHRTRRDQVGPASLWDALAARAAGTGAGDLTRLAQAAQDRGLYRHAAALWTAAVRGGSADAARRLVGCLRDVRPGDAAAAARWAADRVRLDDPWDLGRLLEDLRAAGAGDAIQALLARDPASAVTVDYRWDAIELLGALHAAGAGDAVDALAARIVADFDLEHLPDVASLLIALRRAGARDAIRALVARDPARHADPEEPEEIAVLLEALHTAEAGDAVRALAAWAANDADLGRPQALARLLKALRAVGADDAFRVLLARDPVGHGRFDDPWEAAALLAELRAAGAGDAAAVLAARAAGAGMFGLEWDRAIFPFGREPDGAPSLPWAWTTA